MCVVCVVCEVCEVRVMVHCVAGVWVLQGHCVEGV